MSQKWGKSLPHFLGRPTARTKDSVIPFVACSRHSIRKHSFQRTNTNEHSNSRTCCHVRSDCVSDSALRRAAGARKGGTESQHLNDSLGDDPVSGGDGPYDLHPEVFGELMKYVGAHYRAVGACFGIYPQDPDAVKAKELHWEVGVRVVPGEPLGYGNNLPIEKLPVWSDRELEGALRKMKQPQSPYRLKLLTKTNAAVVDSTVAKAAQDGLAMFPWMAKNGYVQVAATRMEYLSHEGPLSEMKVAIIVPIEQRPSGLRLSH